MVTEKKSLLESEGQLEMNELVDWERFRPTLEEVFGTPSTGYGIHTNPAMSYPS